MEVEVLTKLAENQFTGFPQMISHGVTASGHVYIIMKKKYGPCIKDMLRRSKTQRLSIKTAI